MLCFSDNISGVPGVAGPRGHCRPVYTFNRRKRRRKKNNKKKVEI